MTDWFLVEEIDNETFAISEPKHWEETHSYLVCGRRAAVLIDTGLGVGDIRGVVERLSRSPFWWQRLMCTGIISAGTACLKTLPFMKRNGHGWRNSFLCRFPLSDSI